MPLIDTKTKGCATLPLDDGAKVTIKYSQISVDIDIHGTVITLSESEARSLCGFLEDYLPKESSGKKGWNTLLDDSGNCTIKCSMCGTVLSKRTKIQC